MGRKGGVSAYIWSQLRNNDYNIVQVGDSVTVGLVSGKRDVFYNTTLPGDFLSEGGNNSVYSWARNAFAQEVPGQRRSEEHTSELQSFRHLVCRLLPEKKTKKI